MLPKVIHDRERLVVTLRSMGDPSSPRLFDFLWLLAMQRDLARAMR
jgi:hypothetical protein